jgi:hypothetical protein
MLHFYPKDRRSLYRAHKFHSRHVEGEYTEEDLLSAINESCESKATAEQVRQIVLAASTVSCDTRPPVDDENVTDENIVRVAAPEDTRPDISFEKKESLALMQQYIKKLPLLQRKLLVLKGVDIED